MSVLSHRRASRAALLTAAGSLAAATALLAAPSATALGAPYADFDTLTVSPAASSYADGTTVTVSGSGLAPGAYDLSVCEYDSYATAVRPGASVPMEKRVMSSSPLSKQASSAVEGRHTTSTSAAGCASAKPARIAGSQSSA